MKVDTAIDLFGDLVESLTPKIQESVISIYDLFGSQEVNGLPLRNITCIKTHCSKEASACLADKVCVESFQCSSGCGSDNSTCTFMCSESYKSKAQDNLMYCMF